MVHAAAVRIGPTARMPARLADIVIHWRFPQRYAQLATSRTPVHSNADVAVQMRAARHTIVALVAMHRTAVVHGAVCPANVHYKQGASGKRYKLSGFASARFTGTDTRVPVRTLPTAVAQSAQQYAPPERRDRRGYTSDKSDVFSYGVTMYHLLTGTLPHRVVRGAVEPLPRKAARRPAVLENAFHLLDDCMRRHPENRPSARQVEQRLGIIVASLVRHDSSFAKGNGVAVRPLRLVAFGTPHPSLLPNAGVRHSAALGVCIRLLTRGHLLLVAVYCS